MGLRIHHVARARPAGEVLSLLGRRREAEVDLRAAIRLSTAWMGAEHHWNDDPMTALAKTLTAAGRRRGDSVAADRAPHP